MSTTPTVLGLFIVFTGTLIIVLELVLRRSASNNGLIFLNNVRGLQTWQVFLYLYLPTIISVCYGFVWTWIDLDVRRLEAYYQLAKPEGASAEDSLLLTYPVDFIAWVPIKAWKKR